MAAENELPDNDELKKKALLRLSVAGLVTVAALAGLWWLDQDRQTSDKATPAGPQPAPIQIAPMAETPSPQVEEEVAEALPEEVTEEDGADSPLAAVPAHEDHSLADSAIPKDTPPPPRVSNAPRPLRAESEAPAARPAAPAMPEPARVSPGSARTGSGGFMLQLGVFNDPARAEELVQRLRQQGLRASTETRVHLGPYLNREEAEKARAEVRRLGMEGLVTTLPATK